MSNEEIKKPSRVIGYIIFCIGLIFSIISIYFDNIMSLYLGIAFIFWGTSVLYLVPIEYIDRSILSTINTAYQKNIANILKEYDYNGKPKYITLKNVYGLGNTILFIPKKNIKDIKSYEELYSDDIRTHSPEGIKLIPSGLYLMRHMEDKLSLNFIFIKLIELEDKLNFALVENFDLVKNIKVEIEDNEVVVLMEGYLTSRTVSEFNDLIHDPIISCLACILSRITLKTVEILKIEVKHDNLIEIIYSLKKNEGEMMNE